MRELSLDRVAKAAATLKDKGWREMKTQLALPGETNPRIEVERMVKIREAIGPDIKLMCDINQRWRVEQAIDIGCRVEDAGVGLLWLEDVTAADVILGSPASPTRCRRRSPAASTSGVSCRSVI